MTRTQTLIPTEQSEAEAFTSWLHEKGLLFHHGNDNMYCRSWGQLRKMKDAGFTKGFPDFTILTDKGILFVELKRTKRYSVSPEQEMWIAALNRLDGVEARVCKGAEEAKAFVSEVL